MDALKASNNKKLAVLINMQKCILKLVDKF